jgi:hypothetical protein
MAKLLLMALLATADIHITVFPLAALNGNSRWITCRVTPNDDNRRLIFGIENSERENSEVPLFGAKAPITHGPFEVKRVGCDAGPDAYCIVVHADGSKKKVVQQITVSGCDGGPARGR